MNEIVICVCYKGVDLVNKHNKKHVNENILRVGEETFKRSLIMNDFTWHVID
jgi:hypothetical protein